MRIAELNLIAFGRFTDENLCFDRRGTDLHLIYGPNEAGKTTALAALRSLLYGVPRLSPYVFRHGTAQLRVGATLELTDGSALRVFRRKGTKDTLLDASGKPLGDGLFAPILGALEYKQFTQMFALTHDDLVGGGKEIAEGSGDAGDALFAAGLGGVGLNSLRRKLKADADGLYTPRASTRPLNEILSRATALDKEIRNHQVTAKEWTEQRRAVERERKRLDELVSQHEALVQNNTQLERIRRTMPLLTKLMEYEGDLAELGQVVPLPDSYDQRHLDAVQQIQETTRNLATVRPRLAESEEQAETLQVPEELLRREAEIGELVERLGNHLKAQADRTDLAGRLRAHMDKTNELLSKLPNRPDLQTALGRVPDVAAQVRLQELADQEGALQTALNAAQRELQTCRDRIAKLEADLAELPEAQDTMRLQQILRAVHRQGDLEAVLAGFEVRLAQADSEASTRSVQLKPEIGEPRAALTLAVPMDATVRGFIQAYQSLETERRSLVEREQEHLRRAQKAEDDLRQLEAEGRIPLESEWTESRETRDAGWRLIKRRYILGEPLDLSEYAPQDNPGDVYEDQVQAADRLAEGLLRESERAIRKARLQSDLDAERDHSRTAVEQLQELAGRKAGLEEQWRAEWTHTGIEPLSPTEMQEWLEGLRRVREAAQRAADVRSERDAARDAVSRATDEISGELVHLGLLTGIAEAPLARLLSVAEGAIEHATQRRQAHARRQEAMEQARTERRKRETAVSDARVEVEQWRQQWRSAIAPLGIDPGTTSAQGRAVLDISRQLASDQMQVRELDRRIEGIDRDAEAFEGDVRRVVAELAPDLEQLTVADATRELRDRLFAAREARTKRDTLARDIAQHKLDIDKAEQSQEEAKRELSALAQMAGCEVEEIQDAWLRRQEHQTLHAGANQTREALAASGDGKTVDELRAEAADGDPDQIAARLVGLRGKIRESGQILDAQREKVGREQGEFEKLDGSDDAAASLAAERQTVVADIRDQAEQYITLALAEGLLARAIEEYREQQQGPMLGYASEYFARVTDGAFTGLRTEYGDADRPQLMGVRAGTNDLVGVPGMSDGTCDQLYLALRLAAIRQFIEPGDGTADVPATLNAGEPLPLIVDDILIRFDDGRARATLSVLGEFSQHAQVIFFTHHARLVELAKDALEDGYTLHELIA